MPKIGSFTFVLHTHLPFARKAGRWPHGEEWLHEAAAETYVPLLNALFRLKHENVPFKLTISLTPILMEQLADDDVRTSFLTYLDENITAIEADISRSEERNDPEVGRLAPFYLRWYSGIRESFLERYNGNLVPAFKQLQEDGLLEIITCAATHGYLPLLDRDESIRLQLRTGIESHRKHLGREPRAIWLPECAYRPGFRSESGLIRPGLEDMLAETGLGLFFTETHMIQGGKPVGVAAGDAIGPYGEIPKRNLLMPAEAAPDQPASIHRPYFVGNSGVAVMGRDHRTGQQVWSADYGYPGEAAYRDFHKKHEFSGMRYWRVTGPKVDLAQKDWYHPDTAAGMVEQHANHFVGLVETTLSDFHGQSGEHGIICGNYDTELFGHWWFEGVDWLEAVLRRLASSEVVELTTAPDYLEAHPPDASIRLPEGSWGAGGMHAVWDNQDTQWIWQKTHMAERRMKELVDRYPFALGAQRRILDQAARELLLLQSSDWPFLVSTGQADSYATKRFIDHTDRFDTLVGALMREEPDVSVAEQLWLRDNVFPTIDYRWFSE